jgi:hypothetical protein
MVGVLDTEVDLDEEKDTEGLGVIENEVSGL